MLRAKGRREHGVYRRQRRFSQWTPSARGTIASKLLPRDCGVARRKRCARASAGFTRVGPWFRHIARHPLVARFASALHSGRWYTRRTRPDGRSRSHLPRGGGSAVFGGSADAPLQGWLKTRMEMTKRRTKVHGIFSSVRRPEGLKQACGGNLSEPPRVSQ